MKKILTTLLAAILILGSLGSIPATAETPTSTNLHLSVLADQTVKLIDGQKSYPLTVTIKNNSPVDVRNLTAQAVIENPQGVYIDGNGFIISSQVNLSNSNEISGTFSISAEDNFETKTIPVKINLNYYNQDNNLHTQSETIYIRVIGNEKANKPAIEIKKIASTGASGVDTFTAGSSFSIGFQAVNTGDSVADNIKITLLGLKSDGITLAQGLSTKDITLLPKGGNQTFFFDLKSAKATKPGTYLLKLKYSFTGAYDTKQPIDGEYEFSIEINKSDFVPSALEFQNVVFPTGIIGRNSGVNISFDLVNKGSQQAENVVVKAVSQDLTGLASKTVSTLNVKDFKPGDRKSFSFDFISTPAAETKNYPVEISVEYTDTSTTSEPTKISQVVGVFVKAPKESADKTEKTSTPKLIIEDYHFDSDIIQAGQTFTMYLTLFNTNETKAVKNIKLFLTSEPAQSVAENNSTSTSSGSSSNNSTSGSAGLSTSVFTPVDSSNTFYIANIAPGKKVNKEIRLSTVPDTAPRTYTITANFEYEDGSKNKYTSTELIGIPVVQKSALGVGEIVLQPEYSANLESPLTVDFYNTGKSTLYNVMVKIDGEFRADSPTYYKGNLTPGSSDTFNVNITPEEAGEKKGKLLFTFEDSTGETKELVKEFSIHVGEQKPINDMSTTPEPPKKKSKLLLLGVPLLAITGAGIFFIIRKRRKNKEDEDLMI